jgi:uncharacterized Ntn-hydrolase superfamily protein
MDGAGSNDDGGKHKQAAQAAQPEGSDAKPLDTPGDVANDDEQVERFYALLANIRAMRSMLHARRGQEEEAAGRLGAAVEAGVQAGGLRGGRRRCSYVEAVGQEEGGGEPAGRRRGQGRWWPCSRRVAVQRAGARRRRFDSDSSKGI